MNQRRIDPTLYIAAADEFRAISESAASRLSDARSSLGQYARMAGDDPGGEQLAQGYDDMARDALQALSDIAVLANTMDRAIMQSGWNHAAAEEAAGGKPAGGAFTVRPARTPVSVAAPPSAFGGSDDTPEAWDVVKDFVGMMWPNADTAKLRSAGATWDGVERDVRALATEIRQADDALTGLNSIELAKLRSEVGDFATDVSAAATDISEVGDLCREYAADVEEAHREVIQMLVQLAIEIAATVAIGAALSVFTFGASAVVAGGGITARIILVAQRIVTFLMKVSGTAARIVARLAAITARIAPLANRFQRTARIVISVSSGTLAAGSSELLVKGRDGNLLVAMGSGFVGGAVTDTVALAFGKYGQRVAVQALANGLGGASSGASNGLLNGDGIDIRQVLISGAGGGLLGAGTSIRGRRGGTADAADPGSGSVRTPDAEGPRVGGSDGPSTADGSGIGRQPDYDGPQVTGGSDSGGSSAGDGGSGTRPDYDGPHVTGGNDAGGGGGDGGGIRVPDGQAPHSPSADPTPPIGDSPTPTADAPHVPTGGADAQTAPHGPGDLPGSAADAPTSDDISRQFDELEADIDRQFDELEADIDRQFDELEADIDRQFDELGADIDRQFDELGGDAAGADGATDALDTAGDGSPSDAALEPDANATAGHSDGDHLPALGVEPEVKPTGPLAIEPPQADMSLSWGGEQGYVDVTAALGAQTPEPPQGWTDLSQITFNTPPDSQLFWTGRTEMPNPTGRPYVGSSDLATGLAQGKGATTLELYLSENGIKMPRWSDDPQVQAMWGEVSRKYAESAQGIVRVVLGRNIRPDAVWLQYEFDALKNNPNVSQIIAIDPATGGMRSLFER
ncbi:WXG100-like domain-containing protein [Microbacterium trichothecenolyticum]